MSSKSLPQLSKDYADGKISQSEYRKMRSKFIQEVISGNLALKKNEYIPPRISTKKSKKKRKKINLQNKRPLHVMLVILLIVITLLIFSSLLLQ